LSKTGSTWRSWTGESVDNEITLVATHKNESNPRGWEVFTQTQMESTISAARAIVEEYNIEQIVGHDDIAPSRKIDPGPAFPMANFKAKVETRANDDDDLFIVRSNDGLNIRSGPGIGFDKVLDKPLANGAYVQVHEANGRWQLVSALNKSNGEAYITGWVHSAFLTEA
jgi:N-acetylmuramoyl-L-alanine amidase